MPPPYLSASWASRDEPGGSSAQPGTRRVARKGCPLIMVDVLRGDLLPTTANIELTKSHPFSTKRIRIAINGRTAFTPPLKGVGFRLIFL